MAWQDCNEVHLYTRAIALAKFGLTKVNLCILTWGCFRECRVLTFAFTDFRKPVFLTDLHHIVVSEFFTFLYPKVANI